MIVLSRQKNESVIVGEQILVTVDEIDGDKVYVVVTTLDKVRLPAFPNRIGMGRDQNIEIAACSCKITMIDVRNQKIVRLGFEAPVNVPLHRLEVWQAIQRETKKDPS